LENPIGDQYNKQWSMFSAWITDHSTELVKNEKFEKVGTEIDITINEMQRIYKLENITNINIITITNESSSIIEEKEEIDITPISISQKDSLFLEYVNTGLKLDL